MSATKDHNDDAYVAQLLAEDARKFSTKYSSLGMSALVNRRPAGAGIPKPNTKFLKNLVRDADSHNAALKKKEELEAKSRLRKIHEMSKKNKTETARRGRNIERESKRRRLNYDQNDHKEEPRERRKRRHRSTKHDRSSSSERSQSGSQSHRRREHKTREDRYRHRRHEDDQTGHEDQRTRRRPSKRESERSSERRRSQDRKYNHHESKDNEKREEPDDKRKPFNGHTARSASPAMSLSSTSSSDPLEELVGPLPPSKHKHKRGKHKHKNEAHITHKQTPNRMDKYFSSNYDPAVDIDPYSSSSSPTSSIRGKDDIRDDQDVWNNALSAYRDRQAYKTKQAARLREAGFGEEQVAKWERSFTSAANGINKTGGGSNMDLDRRDVNDVKWVKKGEAREWDAGKINLDA